MAASGGEVAAMGEGSGIEEAFRYIESKEEFVKVRKKDLERLTTEVMQLRDFLPRLLNAELMESFQKLNVVEKNLERKEQELEQLRLDCEHFKARLETVQADSGREKKEKLALRQQLNEAKQQLLQQAEYCTQMGAVTCTLLWGVSSSEEVVKAILGGDKALKFFNITGQTMESYVKSLDGDVKEVDSDENQFVFALAGIVTNVAAMACGREFLVNSSRVLLDTMLQLLGDLKPGQCTKLKVLMLMSLYNVSINSKGLKYISESPGFIPLLWWLLSAPVYTPHLLCPTWPCPVRSSHSAITRSKWLPRTNFRTQHHPSRSSTVVWTLVPSIFLALGKNFSPSCQLQV
ncbi:heat shock factor 2-binding protein isoform X1 [Mesocricetus auratus]|uniref:Heat shock factor 2-binding protein isoform X1 n=1 Tax=Mesocricetus auratus TaxID=10036 RepID=A0A3Q0CR23_MESAU|nr:heat shock factor 2-binding protein isoform X1 [Mesocricetus auratus]XP_040588011.1 heat shock factor 2-binding protein isoform X1 [Mesocricetus auratus]